MTRAAAIDTLASVVFFTVVAASTEYLIAGLSPAQVLGSRAATIPALILTGRPYGLWRDALFRRTRARSHGRLALLVVDTIAFMSFQVPVYAAILLVVGADGGQMAAALGSATIAMLVLSRPFGVFLDWVRRCSGVTPEMPL